MSTDPKQPAKNAPDSGHKSTSKPAEHDSKKKASPARDSGFAKTNKPSPKGK